MNTTSPRRIALGATTAALILGSALVAAAPANAAENAGGLSDVENSLVHVYTEYSGFVLYPEGGDWYWSDRITVASGCTGWFASADGHIATAGHCVQPEEGRAMILEEFLIQEGREDEWSSANTSWTVEGYEEGSEIDRTVEVLQPDGAADPVIDRWTIAQVLDFQDFEDGDAALLKVANISGVTPLTVAAATPEVGEEVVSIGFPGTVQSVVDAERLAASYKTGTVSSHQVSDGGVPVTEINAQVSGGMSGGPTINAAGEVIGINSFGINGESQSFNFVTDTEALGQFLTSHGVAYEVAPAVPDAGEDTAAAEGTSPKGATAPAGDGGAGILWLVGGTLAFLLLVGAAVAVVIILVVRKGGRSGGQAGQPMVETQPPAPSGSVAPAAAPVGYAVPASAAPVGYAAPAAPEPAYTVPVGYTVPAGFTLQPLPQTEVPPRPPLPQG